MCVIGNCPENARKYFDDVVYMVNQMQWITVHEPVGVFDLNGTGRIDFNDIVKVFGTILSTFYFFFIILR